MVSKMLEIETIRKKIIELSSCLWISIFL
jgi:hypothetical protein